jgi:hypothetical protein
MQITFFLYSGSSAVLSSSNGRSSDEGSASTNETSSHRYKFKNTIKQRFTAGLETGVEGESGSKWTSSKHHRHSHHHHRSSSKKGTTGESTSTIPSTDPALLDEETEVTEISEYSSPEDKEQAPMKVNDFMESRSSVLPKISVTMAEDPRKGIVLSTAGTAGDSSPPLPLVSVVNMASLREPEAEPSLKSPAPLSPFCSTNLGEESIQNGGILSTGTPGGVPAFALHHNGLFYIPLTLHKSVVSPYVAAAELNNLRNPPLHPVTISVCFLLNPKDEVNNNLTQGPTAASKFNPDLNSLSLTGPSGGEAMNLTKCSSSEPSVAITPFKTINSNLGAGTGVNMAAASRATPPSFIMDRFAQGGSNQLSLGSRYFDPVGTERYAGTFPGTTEGSRHQRHSYAGLGSPMNTSPAYNNGNNCHSHIHSHTHSHSHSLNSSSGSSSSSSVNSSNHPMMNRNSRKRHLMSPSSSMSIGYHSWRDGGHSGNMTSSSTTSGSTEGGNYGTYLNEMETRAEEDMERNGKSSGSGGYHGRGRSSGCSPPKRQKKLCRASAADLHSPSKALNLM